tara:strand:+ start:12520 stop:12693 length:174 start_codon:yes stop_codon:yes gene_type:complete
MDTRDIIDALKNNNLDDARDETQKVLYRKSGEHMALRKLEVSSKIGQEPEVEPEKDE